MLVVAGHLIVLQLVLRGGVAARGHFYGDDLILTSRSGSTLLLSTDFLLFDHDGRVIPGAVLLAGLVASAAPLQWAGPVISLVVLQALASLSVLRLLRLVMGDRVALLGPLLFYFFSPLTLPSFAWWAAGLNDLPLQIGLAWVAGDAIVLVRTGNRSHAVSGVLVFAITLAFFEKAVAVPWVAFAAATLVLRTQDNAQNPQGFGAVIRAVARRGPHSGGGAVRHGGLGPALHVGGVDTPQPVQRGSDGGPDVARLRLRSGACSAVPGGGTRQTSASHGLPLPRCSWFSACSRCWRPSWSRFAASGASVVSGCLPPAMSGCAGRPWWSRSPSCLEACSRR